MTRQAKRMKVDGDKRMIREISGEEKDRKE